MTIYLTKEIKGKTHFTKTMVIDPGVDVIEGIFYQYMSKYWNGCGTKQNALIKQQEMVAEKIAEGYTIQPYKRTPENTVNVYDKVSWHLNDDFPKDLKDSQAFVHSGMFLGWLIERNLVSDKFKKDARKFIQQFKKREIKASTLFSYICDGVLSLEDISERGNQFALRYFDFSKGRYIKDYRSTFFPVPDKTRPTLYHVKDTWTNYDKIKKVLDERFDQWSKKKEISKKIKSNQ